MKVIVVCTLDTSFYLSSQTFIHPYIISESFRNNNNTEITVFIDKHTNSKSQAAYLIRKIGLFITEEFCRKVVHVNRIILKISMGGIISEKTTQ